MKYKNSLKQNKTDKYAAVVLNARAYAKCQKDKEGKKTNRKNKVY